MIGGVDILILTRAGSSTLVAAARAIRLYWPDSVFENGTTGERYSSYWEAPLDQLQGVFVYRDTQAADIWDAEGAIPPAMNSMIHLITEEGLVTVVVDDPQETAMRKIVAAISSSLHDDILNLFALEVA